MGRWGPQPAECTAEGGDPLTSLPIPDRSLAVCCIFRPAHPQPQQAQGSTVRASRLAICARLLLMLLDCASPFLCCKAVLLSKSIHILGNTDRCP